MKIILILAFLINGFSGIAQIEGNKNIKTHTFSLNNVNAIKINLYAEVIIDCSIEEKITITADENLFKYIGRTVENGQLHLDQIDWISASQNIRIIIGAPNLYLLEVGTHDRTLIREVDNDQITIRAPIGRVKVSGKTKHLIIEAKNGNVDASDLIAENAQLTLTGSSGTIVNVLNKVSSAISDNSNLKIVNQPKELVGDSRSAFENTIKPRTDDLRWINFRIKNNSWNRNKFIVVGPKKDGSQFSYGFAMMPGIIKIERWSIGTKIYKDKGLGVTELVATITDEDEGEVVRLFSKRD